MNTCATCEHHYHEQVGIVTKHDACAVRCYCSTGWSGKCDRYQKRERRCKWCKRTEAELTAAGLVLGGSGLCQVCADHVDRPNSHTEERTEGGEA